MTNETPPDARDTIPPEVGEDFRHGSTLPPFASDERVTLLESQHSEVMATLGEIKDSLQVLTNNVLVFHDDIRRNSQRITMLAARMTLLDGEEEGEINGHDATS